MWKQGLSEGKLCLLFTTGKRREAACKASTFIGQSGRGKVTDAERPNSRAEKGHWVHRTIDMQLADVSLLSFLDTLIMI